MSELLCAICRKAIGKRPENPFFPFCSHRCRMVDLGKWLGEEYRVPTGPDEVEDELPAGVGSDRDEGEH